MKVFLFRSACIGLLIASAHASAQDSAMNGIKNPELKRYSVMYAGVEAFHANKSLAPKAAQLRFKLRPLDLAAPAALDHLTLRLSGENLSMPVPLTRDGSFVLPARDAVADPNADLVIDKNQGDYRWGVDIRSDGVPHGMRRLGDLRLECEVLVAVGKQELDGWKRAFVSTILLTSDWCGSDKIRLPTWSGAPIRQATLVGGGRRVPLKVADDGMSYFAPISERGFNDETLIELRD
jgi:hypothetical protein